MCNCSWQLENQTDNGKHKFLHKRCLFWVAHEFIILDHSIVSSILRWHYHRSITGHLPFVFFDPSFCETPVKEHTLWLEGKHCVRRQWSNCSHSIPPDERRSCRTSWCAGECFGAAVHFRIKTSLSSCIAGFESGYRTFAGCLNGIEMGLFDKKAMGVQTQLSLCV